MLRIKKEDFYNGEAKVKYLNSFDNKDTAYITSFVFIKSKETEEMFKKDIYEMSKNELGAVLGAQAASTEDSAYIKAVHLEQYIDWAITNGYAETNLNPLSNINKKEWTAQFVAKYKRTAFTRKQIKDMCDELVNYVDQAVLLCIFEGIIGEGYSEMLNLRTQDLKEIDDKFYATLYNKDGESRTIEISEELYVLLHKTDQQTEYINKNGMSETDKWSKSQLLDSPHIFKKTTKGKQEGKLNLFYVNRKFQIYKEVFGLKFLRAKNIENSGRMHMANELYKKDGGFKPEHLKLIAEHYDESMIRIGNYEERATTGIKTLLQSDLFEELYGYKIIK